MKTTKMFWYYAFALIAAVLILFSSCKKDEEKNGPVLTTTEVTKITQTTATSGGNITDDGGASVTARGVCWSTSQNPTINDSKTEDGNGAGSFTSSISGLEPNTLYYVRAYATNSEGSGYGNQVSFETTGSSIIYGDGVTDIDGNEYITVIIGDQEWMAENLRVTRDANGDNITRYCYNNNTDYCSWYGGLYLWTTLMNGAGSSNSNPSGVQGICPTGWHVPSDAEWTQLVDYVVAQGFPNSNVTNGAGNALKSCRQVNSPLGGDCNTYEHPRWYSYNTHHGFDEFGFSAFPSGSRGTNGNYTFPEIRGHWWSSTESPPSPPLNISQHAWRRYMYYDNGHVGRSDDHSKYIGFSVRCVRD